MKSLLKAKKILLFLYFLFSVGLYSGFAQTGFLPEHQPEQDACGALKICADTYSTTKAYLGYGYIADFPGESYSHWLRVQIATPGNFVFKILPKHYADTVNYDFQVFKSTDCSSLGNAIRGANGPSNIQRHGATGLATNATEDFTNSDYANSIPALAGDIYYICITGKGAQIDQFNWRAPKGYMIDFSGSTSTLVKGNPVKFDSVGLTCSNRKEITVYLSKPIYCSSVQELATDFKVDNGSVYLASGINCSAQDYLTTQIKIEFAPYLQPGTYTLRAKTGTDGNTLIDQCGDQLPLPESIQFIVPDTDSLVNIIVCPQQIPYHWNNHIITAGGDSVASFISPNYLGCDSIAWLSLHVVDTLKDTARLFICQSQLPYNWNGISITGPGMNIAQYHSISSKGCDSLTILNLAIITPANKVINSGNCGSVIFEGHTYNSSTIINDTIHSSFGCDSIYRTINITVYPAITPINVNIDTAGCGFVLFQDQIYREGTTITDTLLNQTQCDSAYIHYHITVFPNNQPMKTSVDIGDCDIVKFENNSYTSDTTFGTLFKNIYGCDSALRTTNITVSSIDLHLTADPQQPVKEDYVVLNTDANVPYSVLSWEPKELFMDQTALHQSFLIHKEDTFKVIGISQTGCIDTAILYIKPDSLIPVALMPNAFSPNGDGLNDEFKPFFVNQSGFAVKRFQIFDRWGRLVYQAFSTKNVGWNGTYGNEGKTANPGTYFYYIDIEFIDHTKKSFKGEVTLIK